MSILLNIHVYIVVSFLNIVTVYNIFSKGQIDQSSLYRLLCNQILYDCMNNLLISEWMLISEREKENGFKMHIIFIVNN